MARYFLHMHNGNGFTRDEEGQEFGDLRAARTRAIEGIRSILSEEVRGGRLDLSGRIDIGDAGGTILLSLSFEEALEVRRGGPPAMEEA